MQLDLEAALTLRGMARQGASMAPTASAAGALTDGYIRVWEEVAVSLEGSDLATFKRMFPELSPRNTLRPPGGNAEAAEAQRLAAEDAANRAKMLLEQLGGWLDGIVQDKTRSP